MRNCEKNVRSFSNRRVSGITLTELVVAISLAALISTAIFRIVNRSGRLFGRAENTLNTQFFLSNMFQRIRLDVSSLVEAKSPSQDGRSFSFIANLRGEKHSLTYTFDPAAKTLSREDETAGVITDFRADGKVMNAFFQWFGPSMKAGEPEPGHLLVLLKVNSQEAVPDPTSNIQQTIACNFYPRLMAEFQPGFMKVTQK